MLSSISLLLGLGLDGNELSSEEPPTRKQNKMQTYFTIVTKTTTKLNLIEMCEK